MARCCLNFCFLLLLYINTPAWATSPWNCPDDSVWVAARQSCFGVYREPRSWSGAHGDCQTRGYHGLARLDEGTLIKNVPGSANSPVEYWITLTTQPAGSSNMFGWTLARLMSFWSSDDAGKRCIVATPLTISRWQERQCGDLKPYICEKKSQQAPINHVRHKRQSMDEDIGSLMGEFGGGGGGGAPAESPKKGTAPKKAPKGSPKSGKSKSAGKGKSKSPKKGKKSKSNGKKGKKSGKPKKGKKGSKSGKAKKGKKGSHSKSGKPKKGKKGSHSKSGKAKKKKVPTATLR